MCNTASHYLSMTWNIIFFSAGQVLKHENLEEYFISKVPSLKAFNGCKSNGGSKYSFLKMLADATLFLKRSVSLGRVIMNKAVSSSFISIYFTEKMGFVSDYHIF